MNLRGVHIVVLIVVVAAGLVIYGAVHSPKDAPPQAPAVAGPPAGPEAPTESEPAAVTTEKPAVIASLKTRADGPGKGPTLVVTPSGVFDVGIIPGEGIANREFKLANTGDALLEILRVNSSCGCVKASIELEDKKIAPGGESTVKVAINPRAIHGFETRKTVTHYVQRRGQSPRDTGRGGEGRSRV